ncbi:class 1b ribonucleoside-diphosphate reductase subunit beta [Gardnerella vaginalis]|uniref:class 1b ribonucleoside-diphosphate reductase subunit beta n=1 Tax=Gardnerella TaxID=2701 RepID=UPI000C7A277D|nr:class 1b ribonucleoside-diphosphate reductase subunit beta [Gardnerella vaginalis]PKZ57708.1 class 1b ribonucleoside-diphosphate reductase subunit beta [Gardnerella vaginalis]PKZ74731.1 class 1b ribonucleoside-diphosphate reductase subunit beta [Gardnerella vaginalis]PNP87310.1 class 1b ribonucleoside-diphosphate reductase subunit beta [Gardnerella vaginalis]
MTELSPTALDPTELRSSLDKPFGTNRVIADDAMMADSITPAQYRYHHGSRVRPVNWNNIVDDKDLDVWNRLIANFWLPEKVPLSNDIPSWRSLTNLERKTTTRVFTGLTLLDTSQATIGELCQIEHARTEHEQAIYTNIAFMQSIHARSYSSIFSTLCSSEEIDEAYRWAVGNDVLQQRVTTVLCEYESEDPLKRKIAATMLSSLLLYAGFYLPLYFASRGKMMNTADMIRLILRDKAIHGYYSGYKFQRGLELRSENDKKNLEKFTMNLLDTLYDLEVEYSGQIYEGFDFHDDVFDFVRYNANKALMNLGYPAKYSEEETHVSPEILAALSPAADENHDFFSGSGSSYIMGKSVETDDDDWDF